MVKVVVIQFAHADPTGGNFLVIDPHLRNLLRPPLVRFFWIALAGTEDERVARRNRGHVVVAYRDVDRAVLVPETLPFEAGWDSMSAHVLEGSTSSDFSATRVYGWVDVWVDEFNRWEVDTAIEEIKDMEAEDAVSRYR